MNGRGTNIRSPEIRLVRVIWFHLGPGSRKRTRTRPPGARFKT
jgi:hypothetical protein